MTTRNLWTATALIFLLSTIGMNLWLYEILKIKGRHSLNWLTGQVYSPYIATLIVVLAFMTPFITSRRVITKKTIFAIIILYAASIFCFEIGKQLCYALYCRFCFWTTKDILLIFSIAFILFLFLGVVYWFVTNKLIKKNKKVNILFISFLAIEAIPLSLLTILINTGFGSQTGWVDTVKMGYPIFWTTMLFGLAGILIEKQKNIANSR